MYETPELMRPPNGLEDALKHFKVNRVNIFTLKSGASDPIETDRPELIIPLQNIDGYIVVFPGLVTGAALSTAPGEFKGLIHKGGGTGFLPGPGYYGIRYTGSVDVLAMRVDASNPQALRAFDCGDGSYAVATHTVLTAGVASAQAVAANPFRRYLLLQNDHATNTVWIKLGAAAVANQGIRINPAGGSYEMSDKAGNLYKGAVNAIASGASTPLLVCDGGVPIPT